MMTYLIDTELGCPIYVIANDTEEVKSKFREFVVKSSNTEQKDKLKNIVQIVKCDFNIQSDSIKTGVSFGLSLYEVTSKHANGEGYSTITIASLKSDVIELLTPEVIEINLKVNECLIIY